MKKEEIEFFDIHSHLHSSFFKEDLGRVLSEMKEKNIWTITIGVDFEDSKKAVILARNNENIFTTIGQHPLDNPEEIFEEEAYQKLLDDFDIEKKLLNIFEKNKEKKICVVGTTSIGKTTLIKNIGTGADMDDIIFKNLSEDEKEYVCNEDWNNEIGNFMENKSREIIKVEKGKPVFGTVIYDADLIIYLDIQDSLLLERTEKRNTNFDSALKMKKWIEKKIEKEKIELIKLKIETRKIVGVGECGLDFYWPKKDLESGKISEDDFSTEVERQKELFEKQIDFAVKNNLPLMLHVRSFENGDAHWEAFKILDRKQEECNGKVRANFHFFTETSEIVNEIIKRNFMISLPGVITFADLDESIKKIPLENLMAETDSPFATPKPFRGKTNTPIYVEEIVKKIAEVKNEDLKKVKKQLIKNTMTFWGV